MAEDALAKKLDLGLLISADSHVMEAGDFWVKNLPASMRAKAPQHSEATNPFQGQEGARDPKKRVTEMAKDGVSGEVLYPTWALEQFGITDVPLQEACFRVYNDWLLEYCSVAPERLFGVACISAFRIDEAIRETERCKKGGMRGIMVWQAPPPEYSFASRHYDPLWEVVQALDMPVSMHILTGAPYPPGTVLKQRSAHDYMNYAVTMQVDLAMRAMIDLVVSGLFDRFPKLKFINVENEVSWMPFMIQQMNKYADKQKYGRDYPMKLMPGEYFGRNLFATFFNDVPAARLFDLYGADTWMWSNDFPHRASTWPNSRNVIARDMGHLAEPVRANLIRNNVARVYALPTILPLPGLA